MLNEVEGILPKLKGPSYKKCAFVVLDDVLLLDGVQPPRNLLGEITPQTSIITMKSIEHNNPYTIATVAMIL